MNQFRIRATGDVVTEQEYREMNPNIAFPAVLIPDDADPVLQSPAPEVPSDKIALRQGVVKDTKGNWIYAWVVQDKPPEPLPTQAEYTRALELMYDQNAAGRHYDNRFTCALRAGYEGPFQAEGLAFAVWMDTCNATAYTIMAKVMKGEVAQPTVPQLLAQMPALIWP